MGVNTINLNIDLKDCCCFDRDKNDIEKNLSNKREKLKDKYKKENNLEDLFDNNFKFFDKNN